MPSSLRGPKTLSRWLELDYFDRPRKLRRLWRVVLLLTLLVAVAGVLAWALPPGRRTALQAGPVSAGHAMFNHDCGRCHTGEARTFDRLRRLDPGLRSVPDSACLACHSGDVHHATQVGAQRCASCHKEHRGRPALARVEDAHCTACHADLRRNDGAKPDYHAHVSGFAAGRHPEFRLFAGGPPADPGTIQFNHKVHLVEGGVWTVDDKQLTKQGEQVRKQGGRPGPLFEEGAGHGAKALKQLECRSCHQPDQAGRYMQQINYDRHCQSCHPLAVQLIGGWKGEEMEGLVRPFSRAPAPHPSPTQAPEMVRGAIRDRLARFIMQEANARAILRAPAAVEPERPIPGAGRPPPLTEEAHAWVNRQQEQVERLLFDGAGGCKFCHQEKTTPATRRDGLPDYHRSNIRTRWLEHAVFSHKSHRLLSCTECHAAPNSARHTDVLLPRLETCLKCHSARERKARSDCVECHTYHPEKRDGFRGRLSIGDVGGY
jgi:hypothetical protein